ncbi:MAG: type II CAAX endopeptidase family protein [Dehalococcoidia bacterium]|nr:type II CAAX endopeptidase family protein [Dehalococcoidia bacterium]
MQARVIPDVPWTWMDVVKATAAVALFVLAVGVAVNVLLGPARPQPIGLPVLVLAGIELGLGAIALSFTLGKYRCGPEYLGLHTGPSPRDLLLVLGVVLTGFLLSAGYFQAVHLLGWSVLLPPSLPSMLRLTGTPVGVGLVAAVLAPLAEEVFFRGFVFRALARKAGVPAGIVLSSLLFAVGHMQVGVLVPTFILGLLLAWLYWRTSSLWNAIFAHFAFNLVALAVSL